MNATIRYDERARMLREVATLEPRFVEAVRVRCGEARVPEARRFALASQLELLDKHEASLAAALRERGLSAEAAAMSAFEFVKQTLAAWRLSSI